MAPVSGARIHGYRGARQDAAQLDATGGALKGAGLDVLWPHVLALVALGLVIGVFSLRFVRRALD